MNYHSLCDDDFLLLLQESKNPNTILNIYPLLQKRYNNIKYTRETKTKCSSMKQLQIMMKVNSDKNVVMDHLRTLDDETFREQCSCGAVRRLIENHPDLYERHQTLTIN